MTFLLTTPQDNLINATRRLIRLLQIPVTLSGIKQALREHPDYPSLLSIADSLSQWKIESIGIQATAEQLPDMPVPFVAHIKEDKDEVFAVVSAINRQKITYHLNQRQITTSMNGFSAIYKGTALLAEALEKAGEPSYKQKHRQEILRKAQMPFVLGFAVLLLILTGISAFSLTGTTGLFMILFNLVSLTGIFITGLLLWYEIDRHNPVLHKICTSGKNTNCGSILQSRAAKIGGLISWSEVGFIYFSGGFLSLLLSGMDSSIMVLLAWLNVLALPYVFFSVFYQWRIAKRWCILCLTVQGLLAAGCIVALSGGLPVLPFKGVSIQNIVLLLFSFLTPALIWNAVKPLWLKAEEGKRNKSGLQRLMHDPRIFEALLAKQKHISIEDIQELGITLGNPDAKYKLVKVCNPYCGPCAHAHPVIEGLLAQNPNISARIIFTATNDKQDIRYHPAKHLMAIYAKGNQRLTKQALDDWYTPSGKDGTQKIKIPADRYTAFAEKYPLNGELQHQGEKLEAMSKWCMKTEIRFTPTFFIGLSTLPGEDLYQLPDIYSIEDLKYLLG